MGGWCAGVGRYVGRAALLLPPQRVGRFCLAAAGFVTRHAQGATSRHVGSPQVLEDCDTLEASRLARGAKLMLLASAGGGGGGQVGGV